MFMRCELRLGVPKSSPLNGVIGIEFKTLEIVHGVLGPSIPKKGVVGSGAETGATTGAVGDGITVPATTGAVGSTKGVGGATTGVGKRSFVPEADIV